MNYWLCLKQCIRSVLGFGTTQWREMMCFFFFCAKTSKNYFSLDVRQFSAMKSVASLSLSTTSLKHKRVFLSNLHPSSHFSLKGKK